MMWLLIQPLAQWENLAMAKIFEIVDRLNKGEVLVIDKKYATVVMQQMEEFRDELGAVRPVEFDMDAKTNKCTMRM
jgi:hypothetical protein